MAPLRDESIHSFSWRTEWALEAQVKFERRIYRFGTSHGELTREDRLRMKATTCPTSRKSGRCRLLAASRFIA